MAVWTDKFISVNKYARSGQKMTAVKKIVMHYTANNGATAMNHYNYFNNLKDRYASAHFMVDKNEALCIIPLNEIAYHANDVQKRNADGSAWRGIQELKPNANYLSIGIEMCLEKDGTIHPDTISRSEDVAVELCKRYGLNPLTDIVRHRDVTYKNCPAPWVANPQAFESFKSNVNAKLSGVQPTPIQSTPVQPAPVVNPVKASRPLLRKGDRGDSVKELQRLLNGKGYSLVVDGIFGTGTENALRDFQSKNSLAVDGLCGNASWTKLLSATPVKPKVTLPSGVFKSGSRGDAVRQIQDALNKLNFKCGTADGIWGAKTTDALRRFQSVYCNPADGIYGAKTKAKMEELLNK